MTEFPWAAAFAAAAAIAVASIPLFASLGRNSRLERTAKLLKLISEVAPESPAHSTMKELLNLQVARTLGRAEAGSLPIIGAFFLLSCAIVISQIIGVFDWSWATTTPWVFNIVASTLLLIQRARIYFRIVDTHRRLSV